MAYISNLLPIPRLDFVTYSKAGFLLPILRFEDLLPIPGFVDFATCSKACGFYYLFQGLWILLPVPRFVDFIAYSKGIFAYRPRLR